MADIVFKYFTELSSVQKQKFSLLKEVYGEWNSRINLISRKDFEFFDERHVLHSLAIGKFYPFEDGSEILDFGTGGGFPGIPLAILYPDCEFLLVDSIQKKINVVNHVIDSLNLINVKSKVVRVENLNRTFDIVVGRAVKNIPQILSWTTPLLNLDSKKINSGLIYLKGGEFEDELENVNQHYEIQRIRDCFEEPFFETKKIIRFF